MKAIRFSVLRYVLPACFLLYIVLCRFCPVLAEGYARHVYPCLSAFLSAVASVFPFSLEEVLVVGVMLWVVAYPFFGLRKGKNWKSIGGREIEVLAWIYIWFYLGWGLTYFRYPLYSRVWVTPVRYEEQAFQRFLRTYTDSLNHTYRADLDWEMKDMGQQIKDFYGKLSSAFGLAVPKSYQTPKYFTFTSLYSGVGVLGAMGPFFAEAQLNADLLPVQLPFTYAHEYSHLLGVSSEAEANYWAYQACLSSSSPAMRYCGYFGILPYVLANASSLLPKDEFREWVKTIRPEVIREYERKRTYWAGLYSPSIGRLQDYLYDWFLKSNQISSGRKNYAEVIGIILSIPSVSCGPTADHRACP